MTLLCRSLLATVLALLPVTCPLPAMATQEPAATNAPLSATTAAASVKGDDETDGAGGLLGRFQTDYHGGAVFSIDLKEPPGTAGLRPNLQIVYNSHVENGLLGMRMALSGLSALRRCGATMAQDGYIAPVRFAPTDRLCLDGTKLKAVDGAYWAPGTTYLPEKEAQIRVVARPDGSFDAQHGDGRTYRYGAAPDSRIALTDDSSRIRLWALSSILDRSGNSISFTYAVGPAGSGQYFPSRIAYTLNDAAPIPARREIRFGYDFARPDVGVSYSGGSAIRETARLNTIEFWLVKDREQLLSSYRMNYEQTADGRRSRLVSANRCDAASNCLSDTVFTWQNGTLAVTSPFSQGDYTFGSANTVHVWRDFDNDGIPDLLVAGTSDQAGAWLVRNDGKSLSRRNENLGTFTCSGGAVSWMDFNGDGNTDLVCTPTKGDSRHWVWLSDGKKLTTTLQLGTFRCDNGDFTWADVNGDGRPDLVCDLKKAPFTHTVRFNIGSNLGSSTVVSSFGVTGQKLVWTDVDADGMADLTVRSTDPQPRHWLMRSLGQSLAEPQLLGTLGDADSAFTWADFNGDGLLDLIADRTKAPFSHLVRLNTGADLAPAIALGSFPNLPADRTIKRFTWRDFNADGMTDLMCCEETAADMGWSVGLSRGTSLDSPKLLENTKFTSTGAAPEWIDFSGDGLVDLVWVPTGSRGTVNLLAHKPDFPDLATGISNGMGGTITVRYRPITDKSVYQADPNFAFAYPIRQFGGPVYVITHKQVNDGRLNPRTYSFAYRYGDAKFDLAGRGWLGFGLVTAIDEQNNVISRTKYGDRFPLTGLEIERLNNRQVDGGAQRLLDRKSHAYAVRTVAPGVVRTEETSNQLEQFGSAGETGPSVVSSQRMDYDALGNVVMQRNIGGKANSDDTLHICRKLRNVTGSTYFLALVESETAAASCRFEEATASCQCDGVLHKQENEFTDDGRWLLSRHRQWDSANGIWNTTEYEYDAWGNPVRIVTPAQGSSIVEYDPDWKTFPKRVTNALGQSTETIYDPASGEVLEEVNENGTRHRYELDGFGRTVAAFGPDPMGRERLVSLFRYVQRGEVGKGGVVFSETRTRSSWDVDLPSAWPVSRTYFDGLNREIGTESMAPGQDSPLLTKREYDNEAQVAEQSEHYWASETPRLMRMVYDEQGRLVERASPSGNLTRWHYDVIENPLPNGAKSILQRTTIQGAGTPETRSLMRLIDNRGNMVHERFPDGAEATYSYDLLGRNTGIDAPGGMTTEIAYSTLDTQVSIATPSSGRTRNTYYPNGLLQTQVNAAGESVTWEYDSIGRPTRQTASVSSSEPRITELHYDQPGHANGVGRLTSAFVRQGGTIIAAYTFAYDAEGRESERAVAIEGETWRETYVYDSAGRLVETMQPDGTVVRRTYLPSGFLGSVAARAPGAGAFVDEIVYSQFDASGKPRLAQLRNGLEVRRTFDPDGHLLTEQISLKGTSLQALRYQWNAVGDLTAIRDATNDAVIQSFSYGPQGYLIRATKPRAENEAWTYAYDASGNMIAHDDIRFDIDGQRVTAGWRNGEPVFTSAYDVVGRPTKRTIQGQIWTYDYDAEGRLVEADVAGRRIGFAYGLEGHRVRRSDITGTVSLYPFPDWELTVLPNGTRLGTSYISGSEGRAVAFTRRLSGAGAAVENAWEGNAGLRPGANGPGIPVEGTLYFAGNHLGSVSIVTDGDGHTISTLAYEPFGGLYEARTEGVDVFRYKYVDRERDADTGFNFMTARYQDPWLGRFLTPDEVAVGGTGDNAAILNRYAYGGNSPLVNSDPDGRFFIVDDIIEAAVAIGAVAEAASVAAEVSAATAAAGTALSASAEVAGVEASAAAVAAGATGGAELAAVSIETSGIAAAGAATAVDAAGIDATANLLGTAVEGAAATAVGTAESPALLAEAAYGGGAFDAASVGVLGEAAGGPGSVLSEAALPEAGVAEGVGETVSEPAMAASEGSMNGAPELTEAACNSFPAGTVILTPEGSAPVERLRLGQMVLTIDPKTGAEESRPITGIVGKTARHFVDITLPNGSFTVTTGHELWVVGRAWIAAEDLQPGDKLSGRSGEEYVVQAVAFREDSARIYSIEVAGTHTYLGGQAGVLNHNVCQILYARHGYRQRLERVGARVRPRDLRHGTGTNRSTRIFARRLGLVNDDAGHPIARNLGGPGHDTRYIFPQRPRINRGIFRVFERRVYDDIRLTGQNARIDIRLHYRGPHQTRPYEVIYRYRLANQQQWTFRRFPNE